MVGARPTFPLSARLLLKATIWATLAFSQSGVADVDISEYQTKGSVRNSAQERAFQEQFARERQREAERLRAEQEALAQEREATMALEATRPWPERLTRDRCTKCHPAEHYSHKSHSPLFWYLIVQRMVYLNDAKLTPEEQPVITAYLSATHPAGTLRSVVELVSLVVLLVAILGALIAVRRLRRIWKHAAQTRSS